MRRFLAISGSLRAKSTNTALLEAAQILAPADCDILIYRDAGALPHFNPDLDQDDVLLPAAVHQLREQVRLSDAIIIACPEYARGIPGTFKNALDWLVGSFDFPGKPVALFNASPRATAVQSALRLTLTTMSANLVEEADLTIGLLGKTISARNISEDSLMKKEIMESIGSMIEFLDNKMEYMI